MDTKSVLIRVIRAIRAQSVALDIYHSLNINLGANADMLVPEFAFEVEHTTDMTKGLGRLLDLHRLGQRAKLFVILPIDKMGKFDKEIGRSLFRDIKEIYRARTYEPLIKLYALAKGHDLEKSEFFGE